MQTHTNHREAYPKKEEPMTPGAEVSLLLTLLGTKNRTGAYNNITTVLTGGGGGGLTFIIGEGRGGLNRRGALNRRGEGGSK